MSLSESRGPWKLKTPEDTAAFIRHWEAGVPLRDLASWFGWSDESGPSKAARRLGLVTRRGRVIPRGGRPVYLDTPEQIEAFKRDWNQGITLVEMAALHGFKHPSTVSYQAKKLGLPKRTGGRQREAAHVLRDGQWQRNCHGVMIWVEDTVA